MDQTTKASPGGCNHLSWEHGESPQSVPLPSCLLLPSPSPPPACAQSLAFFVSSLMPSIQGALELDDRVLLGHLGVSVLSFIFLSILWQFLWMTTPCASTPGDQLTFNTVQEHLLHSKATELSLGFKMYPPSHRKCLIPCISNRLRMKI